MAHCYMQLVPVTLRDDGLPKCFDWRGKTCIVKEVLGKVHLMDRWWERHELEEAKSRSPRRRTRANRYC